MSSIFFLILNIFLYLYRILRFLENRIKINVKFYAEKTARSQKIRITTQQCCTTGIRTPYCIFKTQGITFYNICYIYFHTEHNKTQKANKQRKKTIEVFSVKNYNELVLKAY